MATDPEEIQLTDEQRVLLAKQAEETGRPWDELLDAYFKGLKEPVRRTPRPGRSLLDAMKDHRLVGVVEGPGDLSTNPKHLEGFGESIGPSAD